MARRSLPRPYVARREEGELGNLTVYSSTATESLFVHHCRSSSDSPMYELFSWIDYDGRLADALKVELSQVSSALFSLTCVY